MLSLESVSVGDSQSGLLINPGTIVVAVQPNASKSARNSLARQGNGSPHGLLGAPNARAGQPVPAFK
jgi:hypothetical protein